MDLTGGATTTDRANSTFAGGQAPKMQGQNKMVRKVKTPLVTAAGRAMQKKPVKRSSFATGLFRPNQQKSPLSAIASNDVAFFSSGGNFGVPTNPYFADN